LAFAAGRTWPEIPLAIGSVPVQAMNAAAAAARNRIGRGAALSGRAEELIERAILEQLLTDQAHDGR
jgi:hypothetical protein